MLHDTPYADRILLAAVKRRGLDVLALRALTKATHLLGLALGARLAQMRESGDPPQVTFARIQEQALHARLYFEAGQILASRWDRLPERRGPHYTSLARFRILRVKQLLALSADETARFFRVSSATILGWEQEAAAAPERQTVGSLPPVRRYSDIVRHVVQTMTLAGFPGARTVAQTLARAG